MANPLARLLLLLSATLFIAAEASADNQPPIYTAPAENPQFHMGGASAELDLKTLFRDPDVAGTAVRVNVRLGSVTKSFDLALYDQDKPITVTNFLQYVSSGRYAANIFHRSVPGFVVQGGGFRWTSQGVEAVPTYPTIQNEPNISNLRGTVAMAKLGGDPNSASSQWFVNLADNHLNLDAQNGGFTVFGRVVGTGMSVVDEVAALQTVNAGGAFDSLPVKDYVSGNVQRINTVETDVAVIPTLSFTVISSAPNTLAASVTGSQLRLTPSATGSGPVTVTITATDLDGGTVQGVLSLSVASPVVGWHTESAGNGDLLGLHYNLAEPGDFNTSAAALHFASSGLGVPIQKSFTIRNDGNAPINGLNGVPVGANAGDFTVTGGITPLPPGETTTFTVSFKPGASGARTASLHVTDADGAVGAFDLALTGSGIPVLIPSAVPAQTVAAADDGTGVIPDFRPSLVVTSDSAAQASLAQSPAPGSTQPLGTYPLVFSATNAGGVTATVQTTVTVMFGRVEAPRISLTYGSPGAALPTDGGSGLPPEATLTAFGTPAISNQRDLVARATIVAGKSRLAAIYGENATRDSKLIARQGQLAGLTNAPTATFKSFLDPLISPGGAVAFAATVSGVKPSEDQGVWTDLFGAMQPLLQEGTALPGLPAFRLKSVMSMSLEDDALLALVKLMPRAGVIAAVSDTALVRITGPAAGVVLARTGTTFQNSKIKQISALQPAVHALGQGRWESSAGTLAKLTLQDKRSLVVRLKDDGTQIPLIQSGAVDPKFSTRLAALSLPAAGGSGVAVLATKAAVGATINTAILYSHDGSLFTEATSENQSTLLPGTPKFAGFWDPVTNDQGALLFFASLRGATAGGTNLGALWLKPNPTTLQVVARLGSPAKDRDGNSMPDANWSAFTSIALPDGPGSGAIFLAQLSGKGATPDKKTGLWAVDSTGKTRLLLRTGDDVDYSGKTERVTSITALNALPGSFGARRSYNTTGSIAVRVVFKDLSTAILRLDVP